MNFSKNDIKNPSYNADGNIDLELKHPEHGWIPYTLNMEDIDNTVSNDELKSILDTMSIAEYVEPEVPIQEEEVKNIIDSL